MSLKENIKVRNAMADALAALFTGGAVMRIATGAPAGVTNAAGGTALGTLTLPSTPFNAAASGSITKAGTWEDASADATGTAGHFRITSTDGLSVIEGVCTATGGGGELELSTLSFVAGGDVLITAFTFTPGQS